MDVIEFRSADERDEIEWRSPPPADEMDEPSDERRDDVEPRAGGNMDREEDGPTEEGMMDCGGGGGRSGEAFEECNGGRRPDELEPGRVVGIDDSGGRITRPPCSEFARWGGGGAMCASRDDRGPCACGGGAG